MELLTHYKSFIESVPGNQVAANGHLMRETSEGLKPIVWEGKEVVLPTAEFLANPDWNKYMAFHPMCESIARGESDIIQLAQTFVRISLWDNYIDVARALLHIAADQTLQTKLTPAQQKLLAAISDADGTTLENFGKIIAKSRHDYSEGHDRRLIAVFLRRGGSQDGQHYSRMFVVRFPMYNELCKAEEAKDAKERKVFDVQLRAKDIPVLKALHETIFPGDESAYTIGTNSNLAPYYTALLTGYANMARQLNAIVKPFMKSVKTLKQIDLSWDEGDNLSVFRNAIPALPHNEGNDPVADPNTAAQPQQPVMAQPTAPAPVQQPTTLADYTKPVATISTPAQQPQHPTQQPATIGTSKVQPNNNNTVSWQDLSKTQQPQQPYGYPQQPYGYPQMMQPQMMPQPMMQQQPMMMPQQQYQPAYMPIMANGMPQPPMPPVTQPAQQPQQMQYMPQPMVQPQMQYMQQPMMQQPMMMQPGMMQPYQQQPQFQFVQGR